MKVILEKNGNVTIDFEDDLLVTSKTNLVINNKSGKHLTICNANIIGSNICNNKLTFKEYMKHCYKECIKQYVK